MRVAALNANQAIKFTASCSENRKRNRKKMGKGVLSPDKTGRLHVVEMFGRKEEQENYRRKIVQKKSVEASTKLICNSLMRTYMRNCRGQLRGTLFPKYVTRMAFGLVSSPTPTSRR